MGVDMMNFERDRANLQATLDRAVLAAADLDQKLPPKDVVKSYLEKSGTPGKLVGEPVVVTGLGLRKVTATADVLVNTNFMRLSGVKTLEARVTSTAEESIGAVEISLVLDMSGSMAWASAEAGKSKLEVLQVAAKRFVTEMISKQEGNDVSISIIPYATQVNAGEKILSKFTNVTNEHSYSHCVNFTADQFKSPNLKTSTALQRTAHFDTYKPGRSGTPSTPREPNTYPTCPVRAGSEITPLTNNVTTLHDEIDDLTAFGRTSIDIAMKWASAMVDPEFRPVVEKLASDTEKVVPSYFSNRPLDYDEDVLKIIVVMTDGENTGQFKLKSSLRSGNSDVWYNPDYRGYDQILKKTVDGEYSVRISNNPPLYYWSRQRAYAYHPYGDNEPGDAVRLTNPQLFAMTNLDYNAKSNFRWDDNYVNKYYTKAFSQVGAGEKNTRTADICREIKDEGVHVYAIAFEAPAVGVTTMWNCASSDSHFFSVNSDGNLTGSDPDAEPQTLEEVFVSIASSIKKLRLTQ
ncbi:hypothetical protein MHN28_08830 [Ruegeria sp. Ofav3-42]|nr:hypothetical protein [Ruegeria sp. Ofav3-42]